jgi:hypothetical protein
MLRRSAAKQILDRRRRALHMKTQAGATLGRLLRGCAAIAIRKVGPANRTEVPPLQRHAAAPSSCGCISVRLILPLRVWTDRRTNACGSRGGLRIGLQRPLRSRPRPRDRPSHAECGGAGDKRRRLQPPAVRATSCRTADHTISSLCARGDRRRRPAANHQLQSPRPPLSMNAGAG